MVRKVRTPFQPNPVCEVSESEYTDLKRQGMVLEDLTDQVEEVPPSTSVSLWEDRSDRPTPFNLSSRNATVKEIE